MIAYLVRRFFSMVICLLAVFTIVFIGMRIAPGDPALAMLGKGATQEKLEQLREQYNLNDPLYTQYFNLLIGYAQGDFGKSLKGGSVVGNFFHHLPFTLTLVVAAIVISLLVGIPIGAFSALSPTPILDHILRFVSVIGISMPSFWLATLLLLGFSVKLRWFPVAGGGSISHLILPAIAVGMQGIAMFMRVTRATLLSILNEDYIKAARAKGQSEIKVILVHALKNVAIPNITMLGLSAGSLLASTVLVEVIFTRPGLGKLLIDSVLTSDYPTVQAVSFALAGMIVLINTATDVVYGLLDPTIRLS